MTQAALPGGLLCVGSTNQGLGCLGKGKKKMASSPTAKHSQQRNKQKHANDSMITLVYLLPIVTEPTVETAAVHTNNRDILYRARQQCAPLP